MKKIIAMVLALTMIFALCACGGSSSSSSSSSTAAAPAASSSSTAAAPAAVNATHLKLNHPSALGGPYDVMSKEFARLVEEKTEGRYVIDVYDSSALGTQEECLDSIALGTLDMCVTSDAVLAKYCDAFNYLTIPYVFEDVDDVSENMNGALGQTLSDMVNEKNMIVISYFENGFRNLTSNVEINVPSDLKGVKIRVASTPALKAMYAATGCVITDVTFSELFSALQLGTVDAQENPYANIRDKKFYEVQKYMTVTMHSHTVEPLVMAKDVFDALSAEDQALFTEAGHEASAYAYQYAKDTDADNRAFLEQNFEKVIDPDMTEWRALAETACADFLAKYADLAALKV